MKECINMVSIIVPVFNASDTIKRCVRSLVKQTYKNIEVIILNDGSTDDSMSFVNEFAKNDQRIIVVSSKKNRGVVRMRNIGIRLAKGSWIAFCDADDWWLNDKIEKQLILAEKKKANLVYSSFFYIKSTGKRHLVQLIPDVDYHGMLKTNAIPMSTSMYSVKSLGKNYFEALPGKLIHEDYAYWLKLFKNKRVVAAYLQEPTTCIFNQRSSRSSNKLKAAYSHASVLKRETGMSYSKVLVNLFDYAFIALKKRTPWK